jgi:hypothetical protein
VPDWHWQPVTDDLLDGLTPAALAAVRQVAEELTVRESMIFLDGREFTGEPPGLRTVQRSTATCNTCASCTDTTEPRRQWR